MEKSGFKPAWMKITSTDKINDNEKILHDRSLNSLESLVQGVRISTRQRHHSSTQNEQLGTRYGSTFYPKSNDRPTENSSSSSSHPFQFRRSYSREHSNHFPRKINGDESSTSSPLHSKTSDQRRLHSSSSIQNSDDLATHSVRRLNSENLLNSEEPTNNNNSSTREQDLSSVNAESSQRIRSFAANRTYRRKERLASAPTHIAETESTINSDDPSVSTTAEKQFFEQMGWNETADQQFYQITEEDRENYEKRRQLLPKRHNRSAELMFALHRRSLPPTNNIHHLLQSNHADLLSDDEEASDE